MREKYANVFMYFDRMKHYMPTEGGHIVVSKFNYSTTLIFDLQPLAKYEKSRSDARIGTAYVE